MTSQNLTDANRQWSSRPADERFPSLPDLFAHLHNRKQNSRAKVLANRDVRVEPLAGDSEHKSLALIGPAGNAFAMTHWSFGQLAGLAGAPAGYLRTLASPLVADCLNYGLHVNRDPESVGILTYQNGGTPLIRAVTGPDYGRIWDADVAKVMIDKFGDGLTGRFRQPGEFGQQVTIDKSNCTLYAGDRDMFAFLADEENRVTIPNRRDGRAGSAARGFLLSNSETGSGRWKFKLFLFDYACSNRIIWNVSECQEISFRHTKGAPHRFNEEIIPLLNELANATPKNVEATIREAQLAKLGDKVDTFLATRFGKHLVTPIKAAHDREENRPIESIWDAVTAATAFAKRIKHQDDRVALETLAGDILEKIAA